MDEIKNEEVAPEVETASEPVVEAPKNTQVVDPNGPAVAIPAGATRAKFVPGKECNICLECGSTYPLTKAVASCPACGGKTVRGFENQRAAILAEDDKRFNLEPDTARPVYGEEE